MKDNILLFSMCYLLKIGLIIIFNILSLEFNVKSNFLNSSSVDIVALFISAIIVAPIIETVIFNYIFLMALGKIIKNKVFLITVASFLFSLFHWYSIIYVFYAFFSGIILNYFYLTIKLKSNKQRAILLTIILHLSYNLTGFLYNEVL